MKNILKHVFIEKLKKTFKMFYNYGRYKGRSKNVQIGMIWVDWGRGHSGTMSLFCRAHTTFLSMSTVCRNHASFFYRNGEI